MRNNNPFHTLLLLFVLALGLSSLASCSDNVNETDNSEFTANWQQRNVAYFDSVMNVARTQVAEAKSQYGDNWEDHCEWRLYLSYAKTAGRYAHDSICVRILEHGEADNELSDNKANRPLYTDSVLVNYIGHLIPTKSYKEGRVFDHSGLYEYESYVFHPEYSTPSHLLVSNTIDGYTTALQYMHRGDRWQIFIPQELGYKSASSGVLPAYSTLIFDVQLKDFRRLGYSFSE